MDKPLILLAIPAGFEPATHGVEIRYWNLADPSLVLAVDQLDANQNREFSQRSIMRQLVGAFDAAGCKWSRVPSHSLLRRRMSRLP